MLSQHIYPTHLPLLFFSITKRNTERSERNEPAQFLFLYGLFSWNTPWNLPLKRKIWTIRTVHKRLPLETYLFVYANIINTCFIFELWAVCQILKLFRFLHYYWLGKEYFTSESNFTFERISWYVGTDVIMDLILPCVRAQDRYPAVDKMLSDDDDVKFPKST